MIITLTWGMSCSKLCRSSDRKSSASTCMRSWKCFNHPRNFTSAAEWWEIPAIKQVCPNLGWHYAKTLLSFKECSFKAEKTRPSVLKWEKHLWTEGEIWNTTWHDYPAVSCQLTPPDPRIRFISWYHRGDSHTVFNSSDSPPFCIHHSTD